MEAEDKTKAEEESRANYEKVIAEVREWEEERKRKEEERDKKAIGDMTFGELKGSIRMVIRQEMTSGDLPFLNESRKKLLTRWILILAGLALCVYVWSSVFHQNTVLSVDPKGDKMMLYKFTESHLDQSEIKLVNNEWNICPVDEGSCTPIIVPLEAEWDKKIKLVFLLNGKVFWIRKNLTDLREVKLIDGSWSHRDEESETGWRSFDSYVYEGE